MEKGKDPLSHADWVKQLEHDNPRKVAARALPLASACAVRTPLLVNSVRFCYPHVLIGFRYIDGRLEGGGAS